MATDTTGAERTTAQQTPTTAAKSVEESHYLLQQTQQYGWNMARNVWKLSLYATELKREHMGGIKVGLNGKCI